VSLLVGQAMSSLLFGVNPSDPVVIGLSATIVAVIGLLGSAYPAWKASRVDPVQVLRAE
jgi:ABC-type antimicrobial peptide transport system permease subunit